MSKVLFIEPPKDSYLSEGGYKDYEYLTPLWTLALGTYLQEKIPKIKIKIIDGRISSYKDLNLNKIKKRIKGFRPDFIGLSPKCTNYFNTIELARTGKKANAKVILGGAHALHLRKEIFKHRGPNSNDYCVDAIVQFDGEKALYEYISGRPLSKIKNLVYWDGGGLKENPIELLDLNSLPICDRSLLNLERDYLKKKRALIIYSQKGCSWREKTKGCIFCALMDTGLRSRNPEIVWEEIDFLYKKYHLDSVWDSAENFLNDLNWFSNFHKASFKHLRKPGLKIFTRLDKINEKIAKMLKDINVIEAILGLESGSPASLIAMRKGETVEQNRRVVKLLHKYGIKTFHCFILAAPGESKKTILETMSFIKKLNKDKKNITGTKINVLTPFPGSCAWEMLVKRTGDKYKGKDTINWREATKDWIKNFCDISLDNFGKMIKKVRKLV